MLTLFGISIPVLRIAGGLIIARTSFDMLEPTRKQRVPPEEEEEAQGMDDVAFTPVAMPMLAGPGAIAWITLRSAAALQDVLGDTGMNVITRLMGLVLICLGIRFIAVGVIDGLTAELVTERVRDWLQQL